MKISRTTVAKLAARHRATIAGTPMAERAIAFEAEAREQVVRNLRADFDEITGLAVARIKECLAPGAEEANTVVLQTARWAIDKLVASADAKEATKAAAVGADKLVDKLAELTADDDEIRSRMESIEDAQDAVVARRQPHIVTPPDRVTA